jgi:hypothetical protein
MIKLVQTICVVWNIRGLNKSSRVSCVADLINQHKLDFIGIQEREREKAVIDDKLCDSICKNMNWNHVPAEGTAGGILVGFQNKSIEILSWQNFKFCVSTIVRNIEDKFT